MSRIDSIFTSLREQGHQALMPFICGGRPSLEVTTSLLPALERAGASIVEIGIPFSDPIADGPVIAGAMHEALEAGVTVRSLLEAVAAARAQIRLGLVAMVSVSIVYRVGIERFVKEARAAGFDGFIFPDAPVEESGPLLEAVREAGLTATLLVAPTTSSRRLEQIVNACTGFVYLLARVGITGEKAAPPEIASRVATLRDMTDLPIACGFGVATAEHVRAVTEHADAVIVGSALVRRIEIASQEGLDPIEGTERFVRHLASGLAR